MNSPQHSETDQDKTSPPTIKQKTAYNKPAVWSVAVLSLLSVWLVAFLCANPPQWAAAPSGATTPGNNPIPLVANTSASNGAQMAQANLTPNVLQTDAYIFLDLIPQGKKAPNVTFNSVDGKHLTTAALKGRNVVLVFYQGSFCHVCGAQLTNLQTHLSDFKKHNAEIIAISADDKAHALQTVAEHGLSFPVVPDEGKHLIHQFGVANISKKSIAWPSVYVIDKHGVVQLSYADQQGHRLHAGEILSVLSRLTGTPAPHYSYEE